MVNKEMLLSSGVSSDDADRILAQLNDIHDVPEESPVNIREDIPQPNVSDITSIAQLSEYAKGQIVRLPGFAPNQPFVARLRRPSLMVLMKNGKIPNSLLGEVSNLFGKGKEKNNETAVDPSRMSSMLGLMETLAEAALVSPTYEEIKSAGISLTDEQLTAIFNYTQGSIEDLKSFR